ncbi:hypothetical protein MPSEU_000609500 [Mayamaea pseudoterrestris]|nr:hypothetical protein MPSEU_000609500 [Mayamaea pseudoterrestris]
MTDALSVSIPALLKKTEHYDKDERYMATSDLCEVLKRHQQQYGSNPGADADNAAMATLDTSTERSICKAVLNLLHDKSHDVQAVAVKTLSVLLITVQEELVLEIEDSLTDQVLDASKTELRDVYAIGLRTLVKTVPASMGNKVAEKLVSRILERGVKSEDEEIILACFDILTDLLQRFGGSAASVVKQHEPILQTCLKQLSESPYPVARKRAGTTMACLSVVLSDALLMRMVESLLSQIDMAQGVGKVGRRKTRSAHSAAGTMPSQKNADTRALIRTMCAVSGQVGHRLGQQQIDRILPIFLRFTDPEDAVTGDDDDEDQDMDEGTDVAMDSDNRGDAATALANELRESCFMGFESFVRSCPNEVEPHLEKIIQAALAYTAYDPNYSYGSDEVVVEQEDAEDDYDDEDNDYDDEEDDEDDDDDESWKVRRSAIRALKAVVQSKKHDPSALWTTQYAVRCGKTARVSEAVVGRFKEREENCRVEIIECFTLLLDETIQAAQAGVISFAGQNEMDTSNSSVVDIDVRKEYAPKLVKACEKVLGVKKGNERSKSSALALLSTLSKAPGGVGGQSEISSVFQHLRTLLSGSSDGNSHREGTSKALRLDGLSLVHAMLTSTNLDPIHVRTGLRTLLPEVCQAVKEQWYKIIAEALRAIAAVPKYFVVGYASDADTTTKKNEGKVVADMLYEAIEPLLAAYDVDQEIKECALLACGSLLSSLHGSLDKPKQDRLLQLLLERLKNETTRIAAIKTIAVVAAASRDDSMDDTRMDLSSILADSISVMASFMKYASRSLKQTALEALDIIVINHGSHPILTDGTLFSSLLQDIASLIVDSDLHLCHLSLRVCISVLQVCPEAGTAAKAHCLEPALALSKSSLLQDHALESVLELFQQMVASQAATFSDLLFLLRQRVDDKISRHGIYNIAKCIAVILLVAPPADREKELNEIIALLEHSVASSEVRQVQLSLLITGDLGRMLNLGEVDGATDRLKTVYFMYFDASVEELKSAAAYSLGNACVGSQDTFLPTIVSKLDEDNMKQQYLLLSALREFIQCSSRVSNGVSLASSVQMILIPLEKYCGTEEESVRTMVAECMGSLSCVQPETMLSKLADIQRSHASFSAPDGYLPEDDEVSKKNSHVCWTVATCVKLAIAGKVDSSQLTVHMPTYVQLLKQKELGVRHAALLMVYAAAKAMPKTISSLLQGEIVPALYEISDLKLERKVDLGPFTHKVDDALPLRKVTLSIFATCLETLPQSMDVPGFIPILIKALADAEDIQLHAHQVVISMISQHPTYIAASIDTFVEPLEKTLNKKPGQKAGTELERLNDWIKSAVRVILALQSLEGTMNSRVFADFVGRVKGNAKFQTIIESLQEEQR